MIKCPECGVVNLDDSKTCSDCGLDMVDAFQEMPSTEKHKYSVEPPPVPEQQTVQKFQEVVIKDFNMPFWSMVGFMIKWALASIPAIIILTIIVSLAISVITGALIEMSR
jgi:hypothetical protein